MRFAKVRHCAIYTAVFTEDAKQGTEDCALWPRKEKEWADIWIHKKKNKAEKQQEAPILHMVSQGSQKAWAHLHCGFVPVHIQASQHSADGRAAKHLPNMEGIWHHRVRNAATLYVGFPQTRFANARKIAT
jgi:hypothetical protein